MNPTVELELTLFTQNVEQSISTEPSSDRVALAGAWNEAGRPSPPCHPSAAYAEGRHVRRLKPPSSGETYRPRNVPSSFVSAGRLSQSAMFAHFECVGALFEHQGALRENGAASQSWATR